MFMSLVFTVCLETDPADCKTREMRIFEPITPMACMMGAPAELARWRSEHPNYRIARWACARDEVYESADAKKN